MASSEANKVHSSDRRRFLSVKCAPLADLVPKDFGNGVSSPPAGYISGKLHPTVKNLEVAFGVYIGFGTLCFYSVIHDIKGNKENPLIDSLYFTVTTMTTVGYGDLVPNTTRVKMLSVVFVAIGMGLVGLIVSKAAEYLVEKQEILLVKALTNQQKTGPYETMKDMRSNEISYNCLVVMGVLGGFMFVAIIFLYIGEELDFIDSIYCVCTTITTVGYGDKAFTTNGGRLFGITFILVTTSGLGQIFIYLMELFTESRQKALANWVLTWRMTNLDLNASGDNNGVAKVAEFSVDKLKAMGKISQEDISRLMQEFDDLDVHRRGFLSASDLVRARNPTKR